MHINKATPQGVALFLSNLIYHCCHNLFKTELHKNRFFVGEIICLLCSSVKKRGHWLICYSIGLPL